MSITKIWKQLEAPPNHPATPAMSTSFTLSVDVVCRVDVPLWRPYVSTWMSGGHRCLEGRIGLLVRCRK